MNTTLTEFLRELAKKHQVAVDAGMPTVEEWRSAIERLFIQIREWLNISDPEGIITIKEDQQEIREPGLGLYEVPRLDLRIFGKWIGIIPKARKTVGMAKPAQKSAPQRAEGRVDITDELRRYVLYRFCEDGRDEWLIDGMDIGGYHAEESTLFGQTQTVPRSIPAPFDQAAFENVVMSYLR